MSKRSPRVQTSAAKKSPPAATVSESAQARALRDERIWGLHLAGQTSREIGVIVDLDHTMVSRIVRAKYAEDSPVWTTEQLRQTEHERLMRLLAALAPAIESGVVPAITEARKISESLRKLYGADGPIKIDQTVTRQVDLDIQDLLREAEQLAAAEQEKINASGA